MLTTNNSKFIKCKKYFEEKRYIVFCAILKMGHDGCINISELKLKPETGKQGGKRRKDSTFSGF